MSARRPVRLAAKKCRYHDLLSLYAAVTDPIGYGIIASLARPGGNITGVALAVAEGFSGKWVELLKETVPKVSRMAVLRNPSHPVAEVFLRETQAAGRALGVRLQFFEARDPNELETALSRKEKERDRGAHRNPRSSLRHPTKTSFRVYRATSVADDIS